MAKKNYFTADEIVLCTYIARFGRSLFNEKRIAAFGLRSESSIKMKIQNIAAMLDDKKISRSPEVSGLTGLPAGETGRETNWDIVKGLVSLEKSELWTRCADILKKESLS